MPEHIRTFQDLQSTIGRDLGHSDWFTVDQERVDMFGHAVEDLQWIHLDQERSRRESPYGNTIVHGLLILGLVSKLRAEIDGIRFELPMRMGLFYGINKVRFISPVLVGSAIRLHLKVREARLIEPKVIHIAYENTVEVREQTKPALVAETLSRAYLA